MQHRCQVSPCVHQRGSYDARAVLFYGVVSAQTEKVVEFFPNWEEAEALIAEVEQDEPDTAALLSVTVLEFEQAPN